MVSGNARNDGVNFSGEKYAVHFTMKKGSDDKINVIKDIHSKKSFMNPVIYYLHTVPFIRGIIVQFELNKIFFIMILFMLIWDLTNLFGFGENIASFGNLDIFYLIILAIMVLITAYSLIYLFKRVLFKLKSTLEYHGAEHKILNAYEKSTKIDFDAVKKASRISRWCGTELTVFFFLLYALLSIFIHYESIVFLVSFSMAYEIFILRKGDKIPVISLLFKLGYFCQRAFFTREPSDDKLQAALDSFNVLLKAENED